MTGQRVTVGRFTRETAQVLHDVYVLPSGRTYYRRNLGRFENDIPEGVGALSDLRRCVKEAKHQAIHHLTCLDMFGTKPTEVRRLAGQFNCSFDLQYLTVDSSAL